MEEFQDKDRGTFVDFFNPGDDLFELKMKELDKLVRLVSTKRQKFDHWGGQYEKHPNGEITISLTAKNSEFGEGLPDS